MAFQNCGDFESRQGFSENQSFDSAKLDEYRSFEVSSAEFTQYYGTTGKYFRRFLITFGDDGAFMAYDESAVCSVAISLSLDESINLRRMITQATWRTKGLTFENSDMIHPELVISRPGKAPQKIYVVSAAEEAGLPPSSPILNERVEFLAAMATYLEREYPVSQVICSVVDTAPEFLEYVFTDVIGGQTVVVEAFLIQNNPSYGYYSEPDANTCYEGYLLNLSERAIALKAATTLQTATKSGPVGGQFQGVRYIDFWATGAGAAVQYFIDEDRAADGQILLTNGEGITDEILMLGEMVKARYQRQGNTPVEVFEDDPASADPNIQRRKCIDRTQAP